MRTIPSTTQNSTEEPSWPLIRLVRPTGTRKNSTIASASATHHRARPHRRVEISCCVLALPPRRAAARWRRPRAPGSRSPSSRRARPRRARSAGAGSGGAASPTSAGSSSPRSRRARPPRGDAARRCELLGGGLAHRDRPVGDAAHHHALEHRLAAERRVAAGAQLAVSAESTSPSARGGRPARTACAVVHGALAALIAAAGVLGEPAAARSAMRYLADRACAECRRPLATRRWKRSTRPPVSISFCRPV